MPGAVVCRMNSALSCGNAEFNFPVRLSRPDKLVCSAHEYGPGVYQQEWFRSPDFPSNLPKLWTERWAYVQKEGIAPVLMGEFGGRSVDRRW